MPMICNKIGIAYYFVPKIACTSIKSCLHFLETGEQIDEQEAHRLYRPGPFSDKLFSKHEGMFTFAVVRDPVRRVLSAYANKIGRFPEVEMHRMRKRQARNPLSRLFGKSAPDQAPDVWNGLNANPDISTFCENLDQYCETFEIIRRHLVPLSYYFGPDLSRFDKVYQLENLSELETDLAERLDREVKLPHANPSTSKKITLDMVSPKGVEALLRATQGEYAYLRNYYTPPVLS